MTGISQGLLARYRADPAAFIEQFLIDTETHQPFKLLPAERIFLKYAYQTGDDGRLLYPEQVYSGPKKSGKTGFAALHLLCTILLFGGQYGEGYSVANDLEQAQSRVYEACRRIIEASPLLRTLCKVSADRIVVKATNATISAIASDYASAAGGSPTISVFDELWGYTSERSRRLWDEMVPTPTRKISCRLTVTYAGFDGESTLLEELYRRGLSQRRVGTDLYAGDGILMFWSHKPIASWQNANWLAEMRRSLRANQYLRMIENRFVGSESTFIDMAWWVACTDPAMKPVFSDRSLQVWVAVDASIKHDSTAIVAVTWDKIRQGVRLVNHRIFQPRPDNPIDFEAMIETTLLEWSLRYKVREVLFDPYQMVAVAQRLVSQHRLPMIEYAQSSPNLTATSQGLFELIKGNNLRVYPDDEIRLAISRAVAIETPRGWRIGKEKQTHKIDVVVALSMAALAAVGAHTAPKRELIMGTYSFYDGKPGIRIDPMTGRPIEAERSPVKWVTVRETDVPAAKGP